MCNVTVRAAGARRTSRPRWRLLYGCTFVMLGSLVVVEVVTAPSALRTALRCSVALGGFFAMGLWVRLNRAALDQHAWCACAAETITVRVIPSRRRAPLGAVAERAAPPPDVWRRRFVSEGESRPGRTSPSVYSMDWSE